MKMIRRTDEYSVLLEATIREALARISLNKSGIVFVCDSQGAVKGVLSDGDIRRKMFDSGQVDLETPVSHWMNQQFERAYHWESKPSILSRFDERVRILPILDERQCLQAIATSDAPGFTIGSHILTNESPTYIVAEIGNNHNGDVQLAKQLIDVAVNAGADAVKFQLRDMDKVYGRDRASRSGGYDLNTEYTLDLLDRFSLSPEQLGELFHYAAAKKTLAFCTPWDSDSVSALEGLGVDLYKVASADLTNHDLLGDIVSTGKPMMVSTGMASEQEIIQTVQFLQENEAEYILLHCNSTYPAPFKDVNLRFLQHLRDIGHCMVGYSGHERGYHTVLGAVALGARVIEKHLTLDKTMEGVDHKVSLLPDEFSGMVRAIRELEESLGSSAPRRISQGEWINRENLAKSLVAACEIPAGVVLTNEMIDACSPGSGLQPNQRKELVGRKSIRAMLTGDVFYTSDLGLAGVEPRDYRFSRPWGIPVRYHDVTRLTENSQPDFLEYHLSYRDMDMELENYNISGSYDHIIVHAPELFAGDHLLDLCSIDDDYRAKSISEMQRVIDLAIELGDVHSVTRSPVVVFNAGGFTRQAHMNAEEKSHVISILKESLKQLVADGIQLMPQSMPPYPWHMGGQGFHNVFVEPGEISEFCSSTRLKICLDVSHAFLASNFLSISLEDYIEKISSNVGHIHISDASGIDGEGLQIGEGDIDFYHIGEAIKRIDNDVGFIPEVWQGHKNGGCGFWKALEKLERYI